jgi:hypothetical protein
MPDPRAGSQNGTSRFPLLSAFTLKIAVAFQAKQFNVTAVRIKLQSFRCRKN